MTSSGKRTSIVIMIAFAALATSHTVAGQVSALASQKATERARIVFSQALPPLDGKHLDVKVVEVNYGPGESSTPHSHPCPVIGYVIKGALRMQVKGDAEAVYKTGDSFYEAPNGVHLVSANASNKEPAKFIAYFVCDHDTPLSVAAPGSKAEGGK